MLTTGGVKIGPILYRDSQLYRFGAQFRSEVDQIIDRRSLAIVRRRLGRERLSRAGLFARHRRLFHRPLGDRPDGLAIRSIEHIKERLLRRLREGLDRSAVDGNVHKHRRAGNIQVPDAVMHQLVMPLPLAGF